MKTLLLLFMMSTVLSDNHDDESSETPTPKGDLCIRKVDPDDGAPLCSKNGTED